MTDLAEPRALEPPIVIANRLYSRAAVYTEEGRPNAWGQLMLDGEATILALIAEVERLREENSRFAAGLCDGHYGDEWGNSRCTLVDQAFRRGLEAAAKVADGFTCGGCGMDGKCAAAIRAIGDE